LRVSCTDTTVRLYDSRCQVGWTRMEVAFLATCTQAVRDAEAPLVEQGMSVDEIRACSGPTIPSSFAATSSSTGRD
jgi:hypothetical protein